MISSLHDRDACHLLGCAAIDAPCWIVYVAWCVMRVPDVAQERPLQCSGGVLVDQVIHSRSLLALAAITCMGTDGEYSVPKSP